MSNKFVVSTYRFHTKDKNKLLVIGHFLDDEIGNNELKIKLDKEEISFVAEEKKRVLGGKVANTGSPVTKDYFLWVSLPENWKTYSKLHIVNVCDGKTVGDIAYAVSRIKKDEKIIQKHIDQGSLDRGGFLISGW